MSLTAAEKRDLDETGYVILPDFIDPGLLAALRLRVGQLFDEEGDRAGAEFMQEPGCRRLANLVDKGEVFQAVAAMPRLLEYVSQVLGSRFKLSSLNVRSVNPDQEGRGQPLHVDMGAVPDEHGFWVCNTVWILDDYTASNGALRAIPGSHRWGRRPADVLADVSADHPQQAVITGRAGTVVVMNAHVWHAGMSNRSAAPRTSLHAFYCRWDKPQQQYQKKMIRRAVQETLPGSLREILALDDPLNDEISADVAVRSGFMK